MVVAVDRADVDGGTEVKITHEGLPGEQACAGHLDGWNGSFDKLDRRYDGGDKTETKYQNEKR